MTVYRARARDGTDLRKPCLAGVGLGGLQRQLVPPLQLCFECCDLALQLLAMFRILHAQPSESVEFCLEVRPREELQIDGCVLRWPRYEHMRKAQAFVDSALSGASDTHGEARPMVCQADQLSD